MWGQEIAGYEAEQARPIIPTRVGTRSRASVHPYLTLDHPHACGDKGHLTALCLADGGSSPRVWGQVSSQRCLQLWSRIIPTRVGTSGEVPDYDCVCRDHPHACGDKSLYLHFSRLSLGSSPRVWGQVSDIIVSLRTSRIIPTRVGTSKMTKKEEWEAKDHPHACGDK